MNFKKRNTNKEKQSQEELLYNISPKEYSELDESERTLWVPIKAKYERVHPLCKIAWGVFAVCAVIYVAASFSPAFADFFNLYISSAFRFLLAQITNPIPFSLAEFLIITLPISAFILIRYLLKYRCETKKSAMVASISVLSFTSILLSVFVLCFATGYKGTSLDQKLEIESTAVDAQELHNTAKHLVEQINELVPQIMYENNGFSVMPYDLKEMNGKLLDAYDSFCEDHTFIHSFSSRLKPIMISEAMSYTHITGVYTYFTGESNINVTFPDYTIPYTAAHELAHQRGIAREDEANMIAFLVCIQSEDPYVQYSAYLNVYEYVASALYSADRDLFVEINDLIHPAVRSEQVAYSHFFDKYDDSVASKVSGAVNDAYLKSQGTVGKRSYGMVVDLTVAYLKKQGVVE